MSTFCVEAPQVDSVAPDPTQSSRLALAESIAQRPPCPHKKTRACPPPRILSNWPSRAVDTLEMPLSLRRDNLNAERASDSQREGHIFGEETAKDRLTKPIARIDGGRRVFTVLSLENATLSSAAALPGLISRPLRSHVTPLTGKPDTRQVNFAGEPTSARR